MKIFKLALFCYVIGLANIMISGNDGFIPPIVNHIIGIVCCALVVFTVAKEFLNKKGFPKGLGFPMAVITAMIIELPFMHVTVLWCQIHAIALVIAFCFLVLMNLERRRE